MNTSVAEKSPLGALGRMGMVAGLHAGALYLIAASLGIVPPLIEKEPPEVVLIEEPVAIDPPAAVPRPQYYQPTLYVPEPEAPLPTTMEDPFVVERIDAALTIPDQVPPGSAQHLVGVRIDSAHPLSQPVYPSSDIRQGNEGTAEIEVYVLPSGRIGDARIVKSAGSATLDQSALEEARRRWRLLPATRDGEPYAEWHRLKVTFNLRNR